MWERVESGVPVVALSGPDIADYEDATHDIFKPLGAFAIRRLWLHDRRGGAEIPACFIQGRVLSDLGIIPILGRSIRPEDAAFANGAPAWISYHLWKTRYGGSPSVLGSTIGIGINANGSDATLLRIAGVLPGGASLTLPFMNGRADVWYLAPANLSTRPRQSMVFFALGRLRPGVSMPQAKAAVAGVATNLEQRYSQDRRKRPVVESLEEIAHGPARQTMGLLSLGVAMVFLVGCVNLVILLSVEGRQRRREMAIRGALGATRWQLWREVAAEKLSLTLFSLCLGIGIAYFLVRVLYHLLPAAGLGEPLLVTPPLNAGILVCFAGFAIAAAMLWSTIVILAGDTRNASRGLAAAGDGLGYSGQSDLGPGAARWRLTLLGGQVAAAMCLLSAALIASKAYATLSVADLGPEPDKTILLSLNTRGNVTLDGSQILELNRQTVSNLERLPGTKAIAETDLFPPPGFPVSFKKRGEGDEQRAATSPVSVSPDYFHTLGIPVLFGRTFDVTDTGSSQRVAIINLDMAKRNWSSPRGALGSQISIEPEFAREFTVVGVVADFTGFWSQKPVPTIYLPEAQTAGWCGTIILRTIATPRSVAALAPQLLAGMTVPVTVSEVYTMQERWKQTLTRPAARMAGMLLLALLGLALSIQGAYAVAAGTVTTRRRDLAIRSALGAERSDLVWSVMRGLITAVLLGVVVGLIALLGVHRVLEQWLGAKVAGQPGPIAIAIALLVLASVLGCYGPLRQTARAKPLDVLRES